MLLDPVHISFLLAHDQHLHISPGHGCLQSFTNPKLITTHLKTFLLIFCCFFCWFSSFKTQSSLVSQEGDFVLLKLLLASMQTSSPRLIDVDQSPMKKSSMES